MSRYEQMFSTSRSDGIVVPFLLLGHPDAGATLAAVRALVEAGADAIELGIPFSDPVADGPVIQRASARAIAAGATPERCLALLSEVRQEAPGLPIGLLVYANTIVSRGLAKFYRAARDGGADSVLVADVPAIEAAPFAAAARRVGIDPIFVVPASARAGLVAHVAANGGGFTYLQGRPGVTGTAHPMLAPDPALVSALAAAGAPPALIGFGVSEQAHLEAALDAGARGVIVGTAVVDVIERPGTVSCRHAGLIELMARIRPHHNPVSCATDRARWPG